MQDLLMAVLQYPFRCGADIAGSACYSRELVNTAYILIVTYWFGIGKSFVSRYCQVSKSMAEIQPIWHKQWHQYWNFYISIYKESQSRYNSDFWSLKTHFPDKKKIMKIHMYSLSRNYTCDAVE